MQRSDSEDARVIDNARRNVKDSRDREESQRDSRTRETVETRQICRQFANNVA